MLPLPIRSRRDRHEVSIAHEPEPKIHRIPGSERSNGPARHVTLIRRPVRVELSLEIRRAPLSPAQ